MQMLCYEGHPGYTGSQLEIEIGRKSIPVIYWCGSQIPVSTVCEEWTNQICHVNEWTLLLLSSSLGARHILLSLVKLRQSSHFTHTEPRAHHCFWCEVILCLKSLGVTQSSWQTAHPSRVHHLSYSSSIWHYMTNGLLLINTTVQSVHISTNNLFFK